MHFHKVISTYISLSSIGVLSNDHPKWKNIVLKTKKKLRIKRIGCRYGYILSRHLWCNGYHCRKWIQQSEFEFWARLFAFLIVLVPLRKVIFQLFSFQLGIIIRYGSLRKFAHEYLSGLTYIGWISSYTHKQIILLSLIISFYLNLIEILLLLLKNVLKSHSIWFVT